MFLNVSRLREWDVLMPTLFPPAAQTWSWALLVNYIDEGQSQGQEQGCVDSYRGAKLLDLCDFINQ